MDESKGHHLLKEARLFTILSWSAHQALFLYEAVIRLRHPEPVSGFMVIGVIGNGLSAWLLHKDSKHSLNARGAFFHHFKIDHPILQFETSACGRGMPLCEISCAGIKDVSV